MKTTSHLPNGDHASVFNVLIVYDELHSAKHAKELCDRLERRAGTEDRLDHKLWSLDALQVPALAAEAAAEACYAPLCIVAVRGDVHLPMCVKSWISRWGREARRFDGALVVQLHGIVKMNEEITPTFLSLRHIAHDAGLEFLSEVIEPSADEPDYSLEAIHEHARMKSALLEESFPAPHNSTLHRGE